MLAIQMMKIIITTIKDNWIRIILKYVMLIRIAINNLMFRMKSNC